MILLRLYWEFFKIGLFTIGGGLATLPFLYELQSKTGWFSVQDIANMVAVSESTPGPMGVNMATFTGYSIAGLPGGIIAPLLYSFTDSFVEHRLRVDRSVPSQSISPGWGNT